MRTSRIHRLLLTRVQIRDTHQGYSVYLSYLIMGAWLFLLFTGICYGFLPHVFILDVARLSLGASPHISGYLPVTI